MLCTLGAQQMEESSETATTVAIVMTADKGIFPHCGYFYITGNDCYTIYIALKDNFGI